MISPETSDQTEYVPFTLTYTISVTAEEGAPVEPPPVDPVLESVTVSASDGRDYSDGLIITLIDDQHFSITGELSDVFDREMGYLDKDGVLGQVTRWRDVPADFQTLYRYKGATAASVTLNVTAVTDQGQETATITVANNFSVSNSKLHEYVALGEY